MTIKQIALSFRGLLDIFGRTISVEGPKLPSCIAKMCPNQIDKQRLDDINELTLFIR